MSNRVKQVSVRRIISNNVNDFHIQGLANKYKHFRADHAMALLALRGDMGRADCLQVCMVQYYILPRNDILYSASFRQVHPSRLPISGSGFKNREALFL